MPANPVLTDERFHLDDPNRAGWGAPGTAGAPTMPPPGAPTAAPPAAAPVERVKPMTLAGTLTATGVLFALILASGAFGWSQVDQIPQWVGPGGQTSATEVPGWTLQNATSFPWWIGIAALVGVGFAFLSIFKPKLAKFGAPLYALCYGVALGAISAVYNYSFDGIVVQAVLATMGVFLVMLFLYATRIVKVTPRFVLLVVAATGGILVMFLVGWIASLFGADIMYWNEPSPLGIGISVVIVIVAALNLALDFDFIERAVKAQAPAYMEWTGALGVTVTIVWIYLSILRLLALIRQ
jgi:uncharacterized YccA/Bax inhibitor family protein